MGYSHQLGCRSRQLGRVTQLGIAHHVSPCQNDLLGFDVVGCGALYRDILANGDLMCVYICIICIFCIYN